MKLLKKIDSFFDALKQIGYFSVFIMGIIVIVASVLLSFQFIPTKIFSLLTSTIGSCFGMSIVINSYNKISQLRLKQENEKLIQEKIELIKSKELQEKLTLKERELNQLQIDKKRLESMKIDVNTVSPILKLGLLELDLDIKDFKYKELSHTETESKLFGLIKPKSYTHEFIGVMNKKFKAQLGIDLNKVHVSLNNDSILISEINSEFQGILHEETDWLLKELRIKYEKDSNLKSYEIIHNDSRIADSIIEQEREFKHRLNHGIDFKNTENMIVYLGQQFIKLILSPLNKKIEFTTLSIDENKSHSLTEFILIQNTNLNNEISKLELKEHLLLTNKMN